MYYAHFNCPYCDKWWPEECKCDLVAATLAQQLSKAQTELAALREELAQEKLGYQSLASHAEVHERELRELLWRAEEVVRMASKMSNSGAEPEWVDANLVRDKAQALLPDLEAALSEKP